MRMLLPTTSAELDDDALAEVYAYPDGQPWLRANMVVSIDGSATGPEGLSGGLSTPGDKRVFATLRALADVVLVGAGTARAEGYGPPKHTTARTDLRARLGLRPVVAVAVVSGALDLDPKAPLFADAKERTLVLTHARSPEDRRRRLAEVAEVVVVGDDRVEVGQAVQALVDRGYPRIVCEGGPRLLAHVAAAGRLDELCLTVSPRLVGGSGSTRIIAGALLDQPVRLGHLIEDHDALMTRWLRG